MSKTASPDCRNSFGLTTATATALAALAGLADQPRPLPLPAKAALLARSEDNHLEEFKGLAPLRRIAAAVAAKQPLKVTAALLATRAQRAAARPLGRARLQAGRLGVAEVAIPPRTRQQRSVPAAKAAALCLGCSASAQQLRRK